MNKLLICLAFILTATHILCAQDTARVVTVTAVTDTTFKPIDSLGHITDTIPKSLDTVNHPLDTSKTDPLAFSASTDSTGKSMDSTKKSDAAISTMTDTIPKNTDPAASITDTSKHNNGDIKMVVDKSDPEDVGTSKDWDTRWFVSPLFKLQVQDFGIIERSKFGSLSNANKLALLDRSNVSAALSLYKNITGRFSASADLGLSYGHVAGPNQLVGTTTPKSFNLLNATLFYHLLGPQHKVQPFVSVGINDLINDASYLTAPAGAGVKYSANRFMIIAQASYGYAVSKNIANTTMYNLCFYVPINTKKKKENNNSTTKQNTLSADSTAKKIKDSSSNNKDSLANKLNADSALNAALKAQSGKANSDSADSFGDENGNGNGETNGKGGLKAFNYQDFSKEDFQVDTVDGRALVKFVVYFEFNQYDLNSSAFDRIDKVIARVRKDKSLLVSIKGYTDNVGSNEFNIFLSKKRAQMVFDYMNSRGIPSDRITARYYGKENPVADNNNPNTAWLNRRAEIIIKEKEATEMPSIKLPMPRNLRK
ncbi:MAG: OmpA family protein [Bacteroidetes bacterium]|nr:OmpA family protein [Bacteroidota bacterium]